MTSTMFRLSELQSSKNTFNMINVITG